MLPKSKILILKFPSKKYLGGIEKHTLKVFLAMKEKGLSFLLLSSDNIMVDEFRKNNLAHKKWWAGAEPKNFKNNIIFLFSWPFVWLFLSFTLLVFRCYGYNKLYCLTLTEKFLLAPIARILGYKIIWLELLNPQDYLFASWFKFLYKWWSSLVRIIAVSNFVRQQLVDWGIHEQKIKIIYEGVDLQKYKKQEDIFELMAGQKFWPIERFRYDLGYIGELNTKKGLHILIKAVSIIKKEIPQIFLTIIGDGLARENLEWLIKEFEVEKNVKLVGYKQDFLKWIWDMEVFVLPSLSEALGITAIEAMACNKPVIASDVGGLPEVIENKVSGLLVQPNNSQALADAIMKIYKEKNLAPEFIKNGRKVIEEKFNLNKMADDFYKELVC